MKFKPSKYQEQIYNWVEKGKGNVIIEAYAGSGKSTTLVECANLIGDGENLFVAFNKRIQLDLSNKLKGTTMKATTLHALGFSIIMGQIARGNKVEVDNRKVGGIINDLKLDIDRDSFFTYINIIKAIKSFNIDYKNKKDLDDLFDYMNITTLDSDCYDNILKIMNRNNSMIFKIDFEDMIYIPLHHKINKRPKDWIFVDELQDLNNAQFELLNLFIGNKTRLVAVGDKFQCQPKGTKITMGYVNGAEIQTKNIEDIKIGDDILTYDRSHGGCYKSYTSLENLKTYGKKITNIAKRKYNDELIVLKSNNKISKYTKEHKCIARLSKDFNHNIYTIYLMRRGSNYRIGICPGFMQNLQAGMGVRMRMNQEKADASWILEIVNTKREALQKEMYYSIKYNIPMILFNQRHQENSFSQEFIDNIWKEFYSMSEMQNNANMILKHFKRDINYPLFEKINDKYNHFSRNHCFELSACNLIPEYMEVNHFDTNKFRKGYKDRKYYTANYQKIDKIEYEQYNDYVYSLEVDKYHTYVADGILTHNCIYGFRGALITIMDDFKKKYNCTTFKLPITYRCPKSHIGLVNHHVPDIVAFEKNPQGIIKELDWNELHTTMENESVYIARTNRYVTETVLNLLRNKRKATAYGKDIGKNILSYIKSYKCYDKGKFKNKLYHNLHRLDDDNKNFARHIKIEQDMNKLYSYRKRIKQNEYEIDLIETIEVLLEECTTIKELDKLIEDIFSDNITGIVCSTIHKIKGLEFDNVYVMQNKLPMIWNNQSEDDVQQEFNLHYVAHTRSKHKIVLVKQEEKKK